jgi:hypothetical protein
MISRIFIIFLFSPSLRPNRSQNPKRKQLQQKRKRKTTLRRRRKLRHQKRKIQMRNRLHPRPRKSQLKPPLKRNQHLKRNPNMKNASAHLNFQKASQKAILAMKKKQVVTMNPTRGRSNPRKLPVEGFVGQQQRNEKGVDQIPRGRTMVVLLQVRIALHNN